MACGKRNCHWQWTGVNQSYTVIYCGHIHVNAQSLECVLFNSTQQALRPWSYWLRRALSNGAALKETAISLRDADDRPKCDGCDYHAALPSTRSMLASCCNYRLSRWCYRPNCYVVCTKCLSLHVACFSDLTWQHYSVHNFCIRCIRLTYKCRSTHVAFYYMHPYFFSLSTKCASVLVSATL